MTLLDKLVGKNVFVRTVTHHFTGRLASHDAHFLELEEAAWEEAAWIADDGRFTQALANGSLDEVEPYPGTCLVATGALIDVSEWLHALPRDQK